MAKFKPSRYVPAVVAWSLLLCVTGAFYLLIVPPFILEFPLSGIILTVLECILALIVISNFFMATVMDPGVVPKACDGDEQREDTRTPLYKNVEINGMSVRMKWCVSCHIYRPPRCSHCSVCNHCIENFDHHCPWVNNCIGRRNYRQFYLFLISLAIHMMAVFSFSLICTLRRKDTLLNKENISSIVIMSICGLLFVPIVGLTGFHTMLVGRARTTNEQVTGKFRNGFNPFTFGCFGNLIRTLCSPQYPKYDYFVEAEKSRDHEAVVIYPMTANKNGGLTSKIEENVYIMDENGVAQRVPMCKADSPSVNYQKMKKRTDNYLPDELSRDSSEVTLTALARFNRKYKDELSVNDAAMGSKCNLLDESSLSIAGGGEEFRTANTSAEDAVVALKNEDIDSAPVADESSSSEQRYLNILKEAYSNARVSSDISTSSVERCLSDSSKSRSMDQFFECSSTRDFDVSADIGRRRVETSDNCGKRPVSSFAHSTVQEESKPFLNNNADSERLVSNRESVSMIESDIALTNGTEKAIKANGKPATKVTEFSV